MIQVEIYRKNQNIHGFKVINHADSYVCAAVSVLTINTVNSIETFLKIPFYCVYEQNGGFLEFYTKEQTKEIDLLLNTMFLGLTSIKNNYPEEIEIMERKQKL